MRLLPFVVAALSAAASHASEPRNVALADLGLHVIGVGYQRSLSPRFTAQLAAESWAPWTQNLDLFGLSGEAHRGEISGYALRGRVFFHPLATAPTGLWLSPFAQAGLASGRRGTEVLSGTTWAVGATAGWSWLLAGALHLAVGGGLQFHSARFPGASGMPSYARLYPTLDANVGYAF